MIYWQTEFKQIKLRLVVNKKQDLLLWKTSREVITTH